MQPVITTIWGSACYLDSDLGILVIFIFYNAHSRLYQNRSSRCNTYCKSLDEICTIHNLLQSPDFVFPNFHENQSDSLTNFLNVSFTLL